MGVQILRGKPWPPLTGVSRALWARNPERVSKESPGPSGPGVQKVSETVSKQPPESQNRLFGDCFETVSDTFWIPGPEGRERLFGDCLGIPGPEPGDFCEGRPGLQIFGISGFCVGFGPPNLVWDDESLARTPRASKNPKHQIRPFFGDLLLLARNLLSAK